MESLLVNRLLLVILLTLYSTQLEALVCPQLSNVGKRSIIVSCNYLKVTNITNTAVLVEFNLTNTTNQGRTIEYYRVDPNADVNVLTQIQPSQFVTTTDSDDSVLTSLEPNSCYFLDILQTEDCSIIFQTSNAILISQVQNVTTHVYNPLFDSSVDLSAQIVWKALDSTTGHTSYDVLVTTADIQMRAILERNELPVQDSFVNVITMTERNELMYPLEPNSLYYVQVRGRDGDIDFSWSEPVLINTQGNLPMSDLYAVTDTNGQLLSVMSNSYTMRQSNVMIRNVFALDKRNRNIFYFNPSSSTIVKENLDQPYSSQVLVALPSSLTVRALAFNWISLKLYVAVTNTVLGVHKLYYVLDVERVNDRELVFVQLVDGVIMDMIVNPFTGLIHWTEADKSQFRLKRFNIVNKSTITITVTITNPDSDDTILALVSPDISENVVRRCVYVATAIGIMGTGGGDSCTSFNLPLIEDIHLMTADERGIIMTGNDSRLAYFDYQGALLINQVVDLPGLLQLDTVSPGTQPIPQPQYCLSPDITSYDSSPNQTRTSTTLFIEWDTPTTSLRPECRAIVVSTPPLIYVIEVFQSGNKYEQTVTESSANVERLDPLLGYNVTVRVKTSFTEGAVNELPIIANFIADPIVNRLQSTAVSMEIPLTTRPAVSIPIPSSTPSDSLFNSLPLAVIISVPAGLVLLVCCILLVTCICCCCCIRKRSKRNDHRHSGCQGSNQIRMPQHYLKKSKKLKKFKDDDQQPVYILPIPGEVPIYDVRESESFNENLNNTVSASYDYPGTVGGESSSAIMRKNSDSYDYPRQLGSSIPIHILKHRQSSPALSSPGSSSTSFPYPSISSSSSDHQLLASTGKPDKLSRISENANAVERERREEEEEYVYELLSNSTKPVEQNGEYIYELLNNETHPVVIDSSNNIVLQNVQKVDELVDEEYIYETLKKGMHLPSTHQSSIEGEMTGEALYDTCVNDNDCSPPPPLQSIKPQLRPSDSKPADKQEASVRITQMPLPSLPTEKSRNGVAKKNLAINATNEDDLTVDTDGYLIIMKGRNENSEEPYDVVLVDVHRTHESPQGTRLQAL